MRWCVLKCGGENRKVSRTVKVPSLTAWVASHPINDGEGGGDLHYMSVCDYELISRVALADVSGHGHDVSAVTQTLRELMHQNINLCDGLCIRWPFPDSLVALEFTAL